MVKNAKDHKIHSVNCDTHPISFFRWAKRMSSKSQKTSIMYMFSLQLCIEISVINTWNILVVVFTLWRLHFGINMLFTCVPNQEVQSIAYSGCVLSQSYLRLMWISLVLEVLLTSCGHWMKRGSNKLFRFIQKGTCTEFLYQTLWHTVGTLSLKTTNVTLIVTDRVIRIHHLGIMNVCTKFCGNPSQSCWDIPAWHTQCWHG